MIRAYLLSVFLLAMFSSAPAGPITVPQNANAQLTLNPQMGGEQSPAGNFAANSLTASFTDIPTFFEGERYARFYEGPAISFAALGSTPLLYGMLAASVATYLIFQFNGGEARIASLSSSSGVVNVSDTPEPTSLLLYASGIAVAAAIRRRIRKAHR